jgi:hypothetical protein
MVADGGGSVPGEVTSAPDITADIARIAMHYFFSKVLNARSFCTEACFIFSSPPPTHTHSNLLFIMGIGFFKS